MRDYSRTDRVSKLLQRELSRLIREEIKDPRIEGVIITFISITKDLKYGKVFFSIHGNEKKKENALLGLNSAKGFLQEELGKNLRIRRIPKLTFFIDDSLDKGFEIIEKIKKITGNG